MIHPVGPMFIIGLADHKGRPYRTFRWPTIQVGPTERFVGRPRSFRWPTIKVGPTIILSRGEEQRVAGGRSDGRVGKRRGAVAVRDPILQLVAVVRIAPVPRFA